MRTVPLRTFLDIREERPVRELVRRNQRRMVTITAEVRGRSLDAVWKGAGLTPDGKLKAPAPTEG